MVALGDRVSGFPGYPRTYTFPLCYSGFAQAPSQSSVPLTSSGSVPSYLHAPPMASMLDSKPVFAARLAAFGMGHLIDPLAAAGVDSLGDLAFATTWAPGVPDDSNFKEFVKKVIGDPPASPGDDASEAARAAVDSKSAEHSRSTNRLRRLFVESYTVYTADMRRRVENHSGEVDHPRKLMIEERNERLKLLRAQLAPGIKILPEELEPSHLLTDKYVAMVERNELGLIEWSELTCRDQELKSVKKDPFWLVSNTGKSFKFSEASADIRRTPRPWTSSKPHCNAGGLPFRSRTSAPSWRTKR